ncbi:MAG TPA: DUF1254 domain-containing protein, partial [Rhizomicrobium sp.]|nr:DUF1254 domain-containing protein [Rhizomicrobium sp.]
RAFSLLGAPNAMHHAPRVDANARTVVRPSPDLLYSECSFDLTKGPLRVNAVVPAGTYWSVSAFDSRTNNFFVLDDRTAKGGVDFVLAMKGAAIHAGALRVVISPTEHGVLLFRTLINDDSHFAALDVTRRKANCKPFTGE